jgi:aminoglycoside 3-N-acetyltransferase
MCPQILVTRSKLAGDLMALGVQPGDILEVHAGLRSIGHIVGGADALVLALLDAVGEGTIVAVVSVDDHPYHLAEWSLERQRAYREELPAFDPARSSANREHGILAERIRTWPGALRSPHPEAGVAAIGPQARWIVDPHPNDFAFGEGTPYDRTKQAGGKVLLLGAPLSTITMLHHAETVADIPGKRLVRYEMPVLDNGRRVWRAYQDIESSDPGAFPYARVVPDGTDAFEVIARDALRQGVGRHGKVGLADSYLFPARELVQFAVGWLERHFGAR